MRIQFTDAQLTHIGSVIQKELNERYAQLLEQKKPLPFSNVSVLEFRPAVTTMMDNLVYNIQTQLKNPIDI
jgi:hypothetical protein